MEDSKPPNQSSNTIKSPPTSNSTNADPIQLPSLSEDSTPYLDDLKEVLIRDFLRRRDEIINKITQICEQAEDEENTVLELRRLVFAKPILQEAIGIQDLLKNTDYDFDGQILQDLTSDIELSLDCLQKFQDFYKTQQKDLPQAEKIRKTSDFIESTWQQIYGLSIYDPVLINEVSKLEWIFRAFEVLNHNRTDSSYPFIEFCEILKKEALASQNEEIITSRFYQRVEEELQIYQDLIEKVEFFFRQEGNPDSAQKMDGQQANELWQELKRFGFEMKHEIEHVERVLKRASKTVEKFSEFLRTKVLVSGNDLKELMCEIHNSPVRFEGIEELLNKFVDDQRKQMKGVLQEMARRIIERNLELSTRCKREDVEMQKIAQYAEKVVQDLHTFKFADFHRIRRQITERGYEHLKAELWLAQMRLLQIYCESLLKPFDPITFEELHSFLHEIEDYVSCLPIWKRAPFDEKIGFLHRFLHEIKVWIGKEQERTGKNVTEKIFYGFIDVTKEIMRPKKQQKHFHLEFHSTGIQFKENPVQSQNIESLNGKRSQVNQEIDSTEKIEKKMKSNEIHLVLGPLGVAINRKSQ